MVAKIVERMRADGWNPDAPSVECKRAMDRPLYQVPAALAPFDVFAIHVRANYLKLAKRFLRGPCAALEAEQQVLWRAAIWFALKHELTIVKGDLDAERCLRLLADLDEWYAKRYRPASERLAHDLMAGELPDDRAQYEPALSALVHDAEQGLVNFETDLQAMRKGHAQHLAQRPSAKESEAEADVPPESVGAWFEVLGESKALSYFDDQGLRLDPLRVKTALDKLDRQPRKEARQGREQGKAQFLAESDVDLPSGSNAPDSAALAADEAARMARALADLPPRAVDLIRDVLSALEHRDALDSARLIDDLDQVRREAQPARRAAFVRRALGDRASRQAVAEAFGVTQKQVRGAERALGFA